MPVARCRPARPRASAFTLPGVSLIGDCHRVGFSEFEIARGSDYRSRNRREPEGDLERALPSCAGFSVRCKTMRHADVGLRLKRCPCCNGRIDTIPLRQQCGHLGRRRDPKSHGAYTRSNGRNQIGLARGAENPHRSRGWFLQRLQQHVRGSLRHAIGVLDYEHAVACN